MTIIFILFIASLAAVIGLTVFQMNELRTGRVTVGQYDAEIENPLSQTNIATYKNNVSSWLEARTRKSILYALRFSIKVGYFVKSKLDAIVSGVHRKAASHERKLRQEESKETGAAFLETIGEYKGKIAKIRRKREKKLPEAVVESPVTVVSVGTEEK